MALEDTSSNLTEALTRPADERAAFVRGYASVRWLSRSLGLLVLWFAVPAVAQGPRQLDSPELKPNAAIVQHNPPGTTLETMLASQTAHSSGIERKGLDVIRGDPPGNVVGYTDAILLALYKRYSCLADAVVVGHVDRSASHLSTYGTTIYSDYTMTVDLILKENDQSPIKSKSTLIVTRPGGSMVLRGGPVKYVSQGFPELIAGSVYLQFLRYIPESRAYNAIDEFATLESKAGAWHTVRNAMTDRLFPVDFKNGVFESSIAGWVAGCGSLRGNLR